MLQADLSVQKHVHGVFALRLRAPAYHDGLELPSSLHFQHGTLPSLQSRPMLTRCLRRRRAVLGPGDLRFGLRLRKSRFLLPFTNVEQAVFLAFWHWKVE